MVLPGLAKRIGLNEAIVLQQLCYWTLTKRSAERDAEGRIWVWNSISEWLEQFPWLSEPTFKRVISRLRKQGWIEVSQPRGANRTNHYSLSPKLLDELDERNGSH